ncbi:MAG: GyrI-like domain-containing protein [Candidatus Omnitrophica bacterium]|nr:GyrI-like domain-containing protein [Candidatus Omnitrophota bacterium]
MAEIQAVRKEAIRVASVRHIGPYAKSKPAWDKLMSWAGPKGLLSENSTYLGIAYDDPDKVPADKIRYDACVSVGPEVQGEGDITIKEIPAGDYAVVIHEGPYEDLLYTYEELFEEWLPDSGRTWNKGPCIEVYLNNPEITAPEALRTEVWMPLK